MESNIDLRYIQIHLFQTTYNSCGFKGLRTHHRLWSIAYGPKNGLFELKICSRFETCFEQYISMKI